MRTMLLVGGGCLGWWGRGLKGSVSCCPFLFWFDGHNFVCSILFCFFINDLIINLNG
jgi:hypothetical protein